jgi:transcription initiation factor TFIID subunit 7
LPVEDVKPKKTKAGRATKPSAKLIESKRKLKEESDSENEGSTIAVLPRPAKKIKLVTSGHGISHGVTSATPKTPAVLIKAKHKGKLPTRPPGEGYDSEASDREVDPYIEEEFVLRMMPGEDCDYLRTAIIEKKIGISVAQGGADVSMKFFHQDGRRAAITIQGHHYAATLVDLPCVIEGMKSWDRRGWWKSADICQMLWVFSPIKHEDDAKTIELPSIIDQKTFQYPHGLTPPMHFARKRRFRKRISRNAIEAVEEAVEKLLEEDAKAAGTRFEMIDPDRHDSEDEEYTEDEDAEGEADDTGYFNTQHAHVAPPLPFDESMDADLEADLEAAMQEDSLAAGTPISAVAATPSMLNGGETSIVEEAVEEVDEEEDSGDESLEEDDGDDENGVTVEADENEKARLAHIESTKEDIADLEKQIAAANEKLGSMQMPILRKRLEDNIRKMRAELQLKISSLGEGEGDD